MIIWGTGFDFLMHVEGFSINSNSYFVSLVDFFLYEVSPRDMTSMVVYKRDSCMFVEQIFIVCEI